MTRRGLLRDRSRREAAPWTTENANRPGQVAQTAPGGPPITVGRLCRGSAVASDRRSVLRQRSVMAVADGCRTVPGHRPRRSSRRRRRLAGGGCRTGISVAPAAGHDAGRDRTTSHEWHGLWARGGRSVDLPRRGRPLRLAAGEGVGHGRAVLKRSALPAPVREQRLTPASDRLGRIRLPICRHQPRAAQWRVRGHTRRRRILVESIPRPRAVGHRATHVLAPIAAR